MEPHRLTSGIGLCERLDDQALRVTLTDGSADYVLLQREAPSYAFIRVKDGKVVAARILDGRELKVGEVTLLKTSQKVSAAGVEFRNGEALVAVSADAAVDLTVCGEGTADAVDKLRSGGIEPAVTAGQDSFKVSLTPGRTRLTVKGKTPLAGPQVALDALANLHRTIPPRPPAEADNLYRHRAKRLWQKQIVWPRIYHDGAYRGQ
jgi:predicted Fe-Mo cluster-binding NifX family protein